MATVTKSTRKEGKKITRKRTVLKDRGQDRKAQSVSYAAKSASGSSVVREEEESDGFSEEEIKEMNEAARAAAKGFLK
jgi:hypothetical protein